MAWLPFVSVTIEPARFGARKIAPALGARMVATEALEHSVFVRERAYLEHSRRYALEAERSSATPPLTIQAGLVN